MFFYLFCFAFFILIYKIAESSKQLPFVMMAALLPALLEGLRYQYLGTDMSAYGTEYYRTLEGISNFFEAMTATPSKEYGFIFIIYVSQIFSDSIHLYMFICAYLKIGIIYYLAFKNRKKLCSWIFLFSYFAFMYCYGFSLMRQSIALAFSMLAVHFWYRNKFKSFIVSFILAYLMHNSAVVLLLLVIPRLSRKLKLRYSTIIAIICVGVFMIAAFIANIMAFLVTTSFFRENMVEHYMDSGVGMAKADFALSVLYGLFSYFFIFRKKLLNKEFAIITIFFSIMSVCFHLLSSYIEVGFRLAFYFEFGLMLLVPIAINNLYRRKKIRLRTGDPVMTDKNEQVTTKKVKVRKGLNKRNLFELAYFLLFVMYFYITAKHGIEGTIPYDSEILPF